MDLWRSLIGMVEVELTSADPAMALGQITAAGVCVQHVTVGSDPFTVKMYVRRDAYRKIKALSEKRGYSLKVSKRSGLYWAGKALLKRPVLLVGMIVFFLVSLYLPSRIFFYRIEGNTSVPSRLILEHCQQHGVGFGALRKDVRSEKVKNALLESIPQLKWVGVNTSGCVATITVRERAEETEESADYGISSIIALRDGIITHCTAEKGNLLVKPGQVVTAGQVMISGYTDCGLSIRATRAEGEIYAQTSRDVEAVLPAQRLERDEITAVTKKYSLIIGKKRINFYKGSGISDTSCDKMYEESYMMLPGGFQLPVVLITETHRHYACSLEQMDDTSADAYLSDFAQDYLLESMVAGSVLRSDHTVTQQQDTYILQGNYACTEMIGQVRNEEIDTSYGKYD